MVPWKTSEEGHEKTCRRRYVALADPTAREAGGRKGRRQASSSPNNVTLDGAGANSIDPFFQKVFYDYHQTYPRVTVNYSPAGSSVGISDIQQNTVAFGDSEIPMATKDLAKAKGTVLQVPVDLGGVAISYNVPGAPKSLKLAPADTGRDLRGHHHQLGQPADRQP